MAAQSKPSQNSDLFEQTIITVSPEAYADFLTRLDMSPQPNDSLRKTMQTPTPWENEG